MTTDFDIQLQVKKVIIGKHRIHMEKTDITLIKSLKYVNILTM